MRHRHFEQRIVADHDEVPCGHPEPGRGGPQRVKRRLAGIVTEHPVIDRIIAEIARDVPSARPPAEAKNGVSDAL